MSAPVLAARSRLTALVGACHPLPTAAVSAFGLALAAGVGLSAGRVLLFGLAVLTGQLSIGWSNDRIDAGRDARTGRTDKPAAAGALPLGLLDRAAGVALAATVLASALLGWRAGLLALVLVAAGWAYNLGLKSTVWSAAAYAAGFGALPAAPWPALPAHPGPPWWAPAGGALLGVGAHLANALPDLADDAATGVRGLPQRLGERRCVPAMLTAFGAATVVLVFGPAGPPAAAGWGLLVAAGLLAAFAVRAVRSGAVAAPFRLALLLAALDVGLFLLGS